MSFMKRIFKEPDIKTSGGLNLTQLEKDIDKILEVLREKQEKTNKELPKLIEKSIENLNSYEKFKDTDEAENEKFSKLTDRIDEKIKKLAALSHLAADRTPIGLLLGQLDGACKKIAPEEGLLSALSVDEAKKDRKAKAPKKNGDKDSLTIVFDNETETPRGLRRRRSSSED